jgi:signal transduction histidine kinase
MYKSKLIFIFLIALNFDVLAQNLVNEKPAYISVKDGLPDATITTICQDTDGFLWIGTNYGLSRYDGVEFKNYYHSKTAASITGNYINALQILPGHRLLIATTTGLCLFNTHDNTFKNLIIHSDARLFGFENNFRALAIDKDQHIWAGSQTSLYELDTALNILTRKNGYREKGVNPSVFLYVESIRSLPGGGVLSRLQQKNKGSLYQWYLSVDNKTIPLERSISPYKNLFDPGTLRDIVFDKAGNAWFIKNMVDSVFVFNYRLNTVTASRFDTKKNNSQISFNSHISIINDKFFGCSLLDGGLLYSNTLQPNTKSQNLKWAVALPGKHVLCTFYDKENNLWIGTTNGLYKFTLAANSLTASVLPEKNVLTGRGIELSSVFIAPGKVFLTTTGGGIFYTGTNLIDWKNLTWRSNSDLNDTWNIRAISNSSYCIGTQRGLFVWQNANNPPMQLALPAAWQWINTLPITTQFTDKENILWMGLGVGKGVAAFNFNKHNIKLYSRQGQGSFPLRYPMTLDEDEYGDIWMGGVEGRGLVCWNRKTDGFTLFPPQFNSDFDNGIINAIYADHTGSLWLATAGGLIKLDILTKKFQKYDVPQGLSSNTIYSIAADNANHLWIGTKNGLSCMDKSSGKIFNFNGYYQNSEDPVNSVKYDADINKIYFITSHSFYSITPGEWLKRRNPPNLFITSATSSGRTLDAEHKIRLNYTDNNINIAFCAVNLVDGSQNKYFYRLNNQDKNWIPLGGSRQISFSSLLSGQYTFQVKAQLSDGTWSNNQGVVSFLVAAPFWKAWWFIIFSIIAFTFIICLLYRYRIRQIMQVQAIRSRIASDLHDDIGSTLSNIHILTQLSHASLDEPQKANEFLARIAEEVNSSHQSLDDIVWGINSLNDNFEQIAARMRRYAAELFESANIKYKVNFDEHLLRKKLNLEQRRDIYLIFKEALNNVYKHASATSVTITLKTDQRNFKMIVEDDGRGFDPLQLTARNGLKNMQGRVKKNKGIFSVESKKNRGTTLSITMKVFR